MLVGRIGFLAMVGGLSLLWSGCSSDSDGQVATPSDGTALASLNGDQQGSVCDWLAQQNGGYGRTLTCPGKDPTSVWSDQQACKADLGPVFESCKDATVGQMKACTSKTAAAPCESSALVSAECKALDAACG